MLGSVVLDVAIGMAFVYLLLSLIASVVQEILAAFMQLRAANLERGMRSLFSGDSIWGRDLVDAIYNHGLVRGLYSDPKMDLKNLPPPSRFASAMCMLGEWWALAVNTARFALRWIMRVGAVANVSDVSDQVLLPAYIPSRTFAIALIDLLNRNKAAGQDAMAAITSSLAEHHWIYRDNKAGEALYSLAIDAKGDMSAFQKNLENWYNDAMDRVSAWYKKYTQRILLIIGLILAVTLNVDTLRVAKTLWSDRDVRQAMVNAASEYEKNPPAAKPQPDQFTTAKDGKTPPPRSSQTPVPQTSQTSTPKDGQAATSSDGKTTTSKDLQTNLINTVTSFDKVTSASLLPVGWKQPPDWGAFKSNLTSPKSTSALHYLRLASGWLLTAIAVSLGAPFWFDTLNRFMVVRSTIKPQEKSQVEGSKDKAN